jgi:hypothetical protein
VVDRRTDLPGESRGNPAGPEETMRHRSRVGLFSL